MYTMTFGPRTALVTLQQGLIARLNGFTERRLVVIEPAAMQLWNPASIAKYPTRQ
jgi:hypothetical protein